MSAVSSFDGVVARMMQRLGATTTVSVPSDTGVYNPETSEYVTVTTNYQVRVLVFDYTLQSNGTQINKNTLIEAGDKQVFIQPLNKTDPALSLPRLRPEKDFITLYGDVYRIVTVKELNPSMNDAVLFELLARK